jgi:hypothetical protein
MALPLIGATLIGSIISGITAALASRAGSMLAAAGLAFISIKGFQTVVGFLVADMQMAMGLLSGLGGSGTGIAGRLMRMAAYIGLFDAINITISGHLAIASVKGFRVMLGRLQGAS